MVYYFNHLNASHIEAVKALFWTLLELKLMEQTFETAYSHAYSFTFQKRLDSYIRDIRNASKG